MSKFPKGSRVAWAYKHHLNRGASTYRVKNGTVDHDHKEGGILTGLVYVLFDGNKTPSRVPSSELKWLEQEK